MMVDFPISLPPMLDLLSQELEGQGRAHHTGLESLHLMAWKLSGVSYEQRLENLHSLVLFQELCSQ
jgi:hypothetical protein